VVKTTLLKVLYGDTGFPLSIKSGSVEYGMVGDQNEVITTSNIQNTGSRRSPTFRRVR